MAFINLSEVALQVVKEIIRSAWARASDADPLSQTVNILRDMHLECIVAKRLKEENIYSIIPW